MESTPTLSVFSCGNLCDPALSVLLARLEKRCFSSPWSESSYRFILSSPYHRLFLLELDQNIVGWAVLFLIFEEGELQNIAVIPEARGQGFGGQLLEAVKNDAKIRGGEQLHLEVRESNIPARSLYKKYGFCEDGRRKNYYKEPTEDAVLMTVEL